MKASDTNGTAGDAAARAALSGAGGSGAAAAGASPQANALPKAPRKVLAASSGLYLPSHIPIQDVVRRAELTECRTFDNPWIFFISLRQALTTGDTRLGVAASLESGTSRLMAGS
jgi:hypothetical protein